MSERGKAVFLSYASQDADAVLRIADALRSAGVEVWFDQNELVGGDAWDAKIRRQIKECALFVPVISANTNARREGYFRREWKLAVDRTHDMDEALPFLLPVVIDATTDAAAFVPEKFRDVQWTRLPNGETPGRFCERVRSLLGDSTGSGTRERFVPGAAETRTRSAPSEAWPRRRKLALVGILALGLVVVGIVVLDAKFSPARRAQETRNAKPAATVALTEAQRLTRQARALIDDDPMQLREQFFLADDLAQRAVKADPTDGEAWAIAGRVSALLARRKYDASAARREQARMQVERAMSLAPASIESGFAQALFQEIAGDRAAGERLLHELSARAPADWRFLHEIGVLRLGARKYEEALDYFRKASALSNGDARPVAEEAIALVRLMRLAEAEEVFLRALAGKPGRAAYFRRFVLLSIYVYDVPAANAFLEKIPARMRQEDSLISTAAEFFLRTGEGERALTELQRLPRDFFEDGWDWRPKGYLAGYAHQISGRAAAAQAEWKQALVVVEKRLVAEPNQRPLLYWKSLLQALTGQQAEARAGRKLWRELNATATPGGDDTWFDAILRVAAGEREEAITALVEHWPKADWNLRNDLWGDVLYAPWFAAIRDDPRIRTLALEHKATVDRALKRDATSVSGKPDEKSVAVLPFANQSAEKDNEYFSDGIAEELLTTLQKIPGLRVAARTSAFSFKGRNVTAQEVGEKLGTAHVVEGSVQKSGSRVKITARLSRAATNEEVWSQSFGPLELKDVFATQTEIAQAIVSELRGRLTGDTARAATVAEVAAQVRRAQQGGTENAEALRLYLQGRFHFAKGTQVGWAEAERCFEAALKLDGRYALPYCGLADLYGWMGGTMLPGKAAWMKCREMAEKALALAPDLADAHLSLGIALGSAFDWAGGEREIKRAIALNPNLALALDQYAWLLVLTGRASEGYQFSRKAIELDPLSPILSNNHAGYLTLQRRYDEAIVQARKTIALQPNDAWAHVLIGWSLLFTHQHAAAVAEFRQAGALDAGPLFMGALGHALGVAGDRAGAEQVLRELDELASRRFVSAGARANVYLGLRDKERALHWLEQAFDEQDGICWGLKVDPIFDSVRQEPRFRALVKKAGLGE